MIEKRTIQIGPMEFKIELPETLDARFLRMFFILIPIYISNILRLDLGSQKLSLQLRNDALPKTLSETFLQTFLYADLKLDQYLDRIRAFKEKSIKSTIFLEFTLVKMRDIFLRLGLKPQEQEPFLRLAGELSAELRGLSGHDKQQEIQRYTQDLRRRDQVQRITDAAS